MEYKFRSSTSEEEDDSIIYVLNLGRSNFNETIAKHNFIVVQFHLEKYTAEFAGKYAKAASILSRNDPPIVFAQVDVEKQENQKFKFQFHLRGYPRVIIFRDGGTIEEEYKGPHWALGMAGCIKRLHGPFPARINSAIEATNFICHEKITIIGVFPKFCGEEYDNFISFSEKLRLKYDFGYTMDAKHLPRGDTSVSGPLVRLFKPFDELFADTKDFNDDALMTFFEKVSTPVVILCDMADQNKYSFMIPFYQARKIDKVMLFTKIRGESFDVFHSRYREVADKYKGNGIKFMLGDSDYEASKGAYANLHVHESKTPMIVIVPVPKRGECKQIKYVKANLEPDDIAPWIEDYMAGKLRPYVLSDPIPRENNGPVKVVVGDSFHEMFWESRKNVFLEVYYQYEGRSEEVDRILDDVGINFEKDSTVVIAKFNTHGNEIPEKICYYGLGLWDVEIDPVLFFKTASGKIERYVGDRTKQDIIDYINNQKENINEVLDEKNSGGSSKIRSDKSPEKVLDKMYTSYKVTPVDSGSNFETDPNYVTPESDMEKGEVSKSAEKIEGKEAATN